MTIVKEERNERGQLTYREYSNGFWVKREFDSSGRETYYKNNAGYWEKSEYDENGNRIYYENSEGCMMFKKSTYIFPIKKRQNFQW